MSDRELLEMAAKASGLKYISYSEGYGLGIEGDGVWWNPLKNDGQAFRLAVKLEMLIDFEEREVFFFSPKDKTRKKVHYYAGEDRYGIVLAAEQIGRSMP